MADPLVRFTFDGRPVRARAGQSVAAALLEAGHWTLSRSPKYRRPRGVHCAAGHCPSCLLRIDGVAHARSCMVDAREGMRVETEGDAGRRFDPRRAIDRAGRLFPVGFQYRWFKRQGFAWRVWEGQLRKAAAETEIPASFAVPPAQRVAADVLVVGGGPAGLGAAAAAAEAGARVVLATRRGLGGRLRGGGKLAEALERVRGSERVTVLAPATVVAAFGERYVVDAGDRVVEVTARASILATGAYERALSFPGNDRPGAMLTSALHRLAVAERALAGRTAVIVTRDDAAYPMAHDLVAAGVRVPVVLDLRASGPRERETPADEGEDRLAGTEVVGAQAAATSARRSGIEVIAGARDLAVEGRGRVTAIRHAGGRVACDLVGMSGGWQAADELRYAATSSGEDVVAGERARPLDEGADALPVLQAVGAAADTMDPARALAEGTVAGRTAARG